MNTGLFLLNLFLDSLSIQGVVSIFIGMSFFSEKYQNLEKYTRKNWKMRKSRKKKVNWAGGLKEIYKKIYTIFYIENTIFHIKNS